MLSSIPQRYLLFLLFVATSIATNPGGNCTVFNWDQGNPVLSYDSAFRFSSAQVCAKSTNELGSCAISGSGQVNFTATCNVTALNNPNFSQLVQETIDAANATMPAPSFNQTVTSWVEQTRIIDAGTAAYMNFTAIHFCYYGTLANCTGNLYEGTAVQFCAPVWEEKTRVVSGLWTVVEVSENDLWKYPDPFAKAKTTTTETDAASYISALSLQLPMASIVGAVIFSMVF
ncbi:hypothetical protein N7462_000992 [Penicillium macrosclerotiorum]|uniref:uncharacterized protein n=1 Tax=Penicillium macrosclerotiorum TaxID=303699 RepID=UPI00254682F5|nr:uncharacterized protein N7462_000992 [Penicillium macrosclerotiorum]KAJ5698987.1 hypothetical protein N7462_000992 [Penicillium macrosclerotiorum]